MATETDLSRLALNKLELELLKRTLYMAADMINRLMADGIAYTKMIESNGGPNG